HRCARHPARKDHNIMSKRMDELGDTNLASSSELEAYINRVRELSRDLYMELEFGAELLQKNLSTLPVAESKGGVTGKVSSKVRAKKVADALRRAAEANKYAGGQATKTWSLFAKSFAPEIEQARNKKAPGFKVQE